jgi:hypothetical protein
VFSGNSKKEDDNENVEQLEDENKVCPDKMSVNELRLIATTTEYLVEYDFSIASWDGLDQGDTADFRSRA